MHPQFEKLFLVHARILHPLVPLHLASQLPVLDGKVVNNGPEIIATARRIYRPMAGTPHTTRAVWIVPSTTRLFLALLGRGFADEEGRVGIDKGELVSSHVVVATVEPSFGAAALTRTGAIVQKTGAVAFSELSWVRGFNAANALRRMRRALPAASGRASERHGLVGWRSSRMGAIGGTHLKPVVGLGRDCHLSVIGGGKSRESW